MKEIGDLKKASLDQIFRGEETVVIVFLLGKYMSDSRILQVGNYRIFTILMFFCNLYS